MYYRNYEGFLTREEREEKAEAAREAREEKKKEKDEKKKEKELAKQLNDEEKALEKAQKDLDTVDNNAAVQKYVKLNKTIIDKKCAIENKKVNSGLEKYEETEVPEICESTDVSPSLGSPSFGSFSGTL